MFYPRDWKSTTIEVFIRAVHEYILWYTEKRIKMSLGSLSPIEYRKSLGLINRNQSKNYAAPPVGQFSGGGNTFEPPYKRDGVSHAQ
jgi:hypothetical protein